MSRVLRSAARRLDTARARAAGDAARAARGDGLRLVPTSGGPTRVRDSGGPGPLVVLACDPPDVLEHDDAPGARLVVVDDAGHLPELEAPHRLREALDSLA